MVLPMLVLRELSVLRFVPAFFGLLVFGQMVLLYQYDPNAYFSILRFAGIDPWAHPFIDSAFMYAMKDCWIHGVNVYNSVPCDHDGIPAANMKMAYSPLWQRLPLLPTNDAARYPIGLITDTLLIGSLTILPPAVTVRDAILLSLATVSTMVCFALERNNIDVWIYLLAVAGGLLFAHGGRLRAVAYAVFMLAGLLKYYPLSLFGLALREQLRRFFAIAILSLMVVGLFAAEFWPEILQETKNIPSGSPFGDLFGITNIPMTVSIIASHFTGAGPGVSTALSLSIRVLLSGLVCVWAILTVRRSGLAHAILNMPERQSIWLVMGCLIIGFCYLAGQSVGYRGIYLLMVLSGLLALRRVTEAKAMIDELNFVTLSLVVMMWMEGIRLTLRTCMKALGAPHALVNGVQVAVWLAREFLWFNLERIILAVLIGFAMASLTGQRFNLRWQNFQPVKTRIKNASLTAK